MGELEDKEGAEELACDEERESELVEDQLMLPDDSDRARKDDSPSDRYEVGSAELVTELTLKDESDSTG